MIVVKVKVSRGIVPYPPMGIDSADTSQPPNGEMGQYFYANPGQWAGGRGGGLG
jgi:hypothetical protein